MAELSKIVERRRFTLERSTKNTHRFREEPGDEPEVLGVLYVQKSALDNRQGGAVYTPATLYVTIEV